MSQYREVQEIDANNLRQVRSETHPRRSNSLKARKALPVGRTVRSASLRQDSGPKVTPQRQKARRSLEANREKSIKQIEVGIPILTFLESVFNENLH